jgi:hypothetical protein
MDTATLERVGTTQQSWWHVYVGDCFDLGETISVVLEAPQSPAEVHQHTRCHRTCRLMYVGSFDHEPTEDEEIAALGDDYIVPITD